MKHPILTRFVCLLLTSVMLLTYPASAAEVAALTDTETATADSSNPFDDSSIEEASDGAAVEDGLETAEESASDAETEGAEEEPVYLDSDGNYLAPEELVVYVTSYLTEGKNARTDTSYTGIVAFYDYNETDEEEMLDNPYFFYYKDGVLQDEEELYISSDRFLNLTSAPTTAAAASVSDLDEDTAVYSAEEVYVDYLDEEITEHPDYLFAFNVEGQENGLYTGYSEAMTAVYEAGETVVVTGVTLTQGTDGKTPTLTWSAVSGAASYKIYRKTGSGSWSVLSSNISSTSYTDAKATTSGTTYSYYVTAVLSDSSETSASDTVTYTYYKTPTNVKAANAAGGVKVSWSSVSGATGYRILRQASGSSTWTTVGDVSGATSYVDTSASSNKTYSYTVRAYFGSKSSSREDYTVNVWSGVSSSVSVYYLAAPVISDVSSSSEGLVISWSSVAGATSYRVYYRVVGDSSWAGHVTVKGTSYTYTKAVAGTSYYFTVIADNANNGSYSSYYDPVGDTAQSITYHGIPSVTLKTVEKGVQVTWTKDAAATKYRIWRKTGSSTWTVITTVTGSTSSYVDTTAVSGTTYYYTVRAYYGNDTNYSSNSWSSYRSSSALTFLSAPKLGTPDSESGGMRISWEKVSGASGYIIYRKGTSDTSWTRIATVSGGSTTSYLYTGVKDDSTYYYTVKAYTTDSKGNTFDSYWQTPSTAYTYHAAPSVSMACANNGIKITWTLSSGATGYRIYREQSGKRTIVANISAKSLSSGATTGSYVDSSANLSSGTTYQYTVRAYYGNGDIASVAVDKLNNWSAYIYKSFTYLATPVIPTTVENNTSDTNGIKVTWSKVTGAAGYFIYRKTSASGSWTRIATVSSGSTTVYLDTSVSSLSAGTTCYYTVRAFDSTKNCWSYYNNTGSVCVYLPMVENLTVGTPSSSGTKITWSKVSGASSYVVYRRKSSSSSWSRLGTVTTNSYTDTTVTSKSTLYFYTIVAVGTASVSGKTVSFRGTYDKTGSSFAISWSGSERNTWVKKDGKQYYVESNGTLATGWQYKTRNGSTYKYYFDVETGELVTNLYAYFGKSYRDVKFRIVTCVCSNNSTPSYTAIYLYNSDTGAYDTPAAAWRSVGSISKTVARWSSLYLAANGGQRWLHGDFEGASYEQYAVYIHGTPSWFHSILYRTESNRNMSASTYNGLENNNNSTGACIRMQSIYAFLISDLTKNGYGKTHRTPVILYKTSSVSAFGVPHLNKISTSRKTDPTDPDITGKFFYATTLYGISTTASSTTWVYY
ncbi:MAG: hypothetical protein LUC30_02980 [Clostridiales bacterium]|nr:hypothetical protein [Clostridiales bacterium]